VADADESRTLSLRAGRPSDPQVTSAATRLTSPWEDSRNPRYTPAYGSGSVGMITSAGKAISAAPEILPCASVPESTKLDGAPTGIRAFGVSSAIDAGRVDSSGDPISRAIPAPDSVRKTRAGPGRSTSASSDPSSRTASACGAGALHSREWHWPAVMLVDHAAVIASMAAPGVQL
jgi:hypothetical protein